MVYSNPILLLHGALGAKTQLETIKVKLEATGRKVFSLDFPGHHGEPFPKDGFGIDVFSREVVAFLDRNNLSKVDIFGYSMGGYVALWLAHIDPLRVETIITLGTKFDWNIESAEREIRKMNPEKVLQKIPAFARILGGRHHPNDWKALMSKTSEMMKQLGEQPMLTEDILKTIEVPIQIWLGDRDDMADRDYSEHVAGILPKGKFYLLKNTSHPIEGLALVPFVDHVNNI